MSSILVFGLLTAIICGFAALDEETAGWATNARIGFPLPFGRGEGQGEGIHENTPTGSRFPLTPALSPSAGERMNRTTATLFCCPSHRPLSVLFGSKN